MLADVRKLLASSTVYVVSVPSLTLLLPVMVKLAQAAVPSVANCAGVVPVSVNVAVALVATVPCAGVDPENVMLLTAAVPLPRLSVIPLRVYSATARCAGVAV